MKKDNLISVLRDVGLSENESKVYLALLSLGPSTATEVAKQSSIKRTSVYPLIESLKKKGLAMANFKGFRKLYVAEDAKKLESIIEFRKERFMEMLPEFAALYSPKDKDVVMGYFEGKGAIRNAYENLLLDLKAGDDYLVISQGKKVFDQLGNDWFMDFIQKRAEGNFNTKVLYSDVLWGEEHRMNQERDQIEIKILPEDVKFNANLTITPNHTLIHKLDDPMVAILISNKSAIQTFQQMFYIMWKYVGK